jgi:hypothetical protein
MFANDRQRSIVARSSPDLFGTPIDSGMMKAIFPDCDFFDLDWNRHFSK